MGDDGIDGVFLDALQHRAPAFALGHRLARMYPDRYLLEVDAALDLEGFARAGHCRVAARPGIYAQRDTSWSEDTGVRSRPVIAWLTVTWERTAFDVLVLEWGDSMLARSAHHFVLAPDRARAEAFYEALAQWQSEVRGEILVFADGCFTKSDKLYRAVQHASFDQLVLDGDLARQIRDDFRHFLASADVYAEAGVPWRRGALFVGPPGNGKTLCVKALVRELAVPCIYVQSFEAAYATAQGAIDAVFERARALAPCVLVLEDIDALLVPGSAAFFLNELDGFASNAGVITLATTNHAERLDPSILERPSRFDRTYHFGLPPEAARRAYVALWNERLRPPLRLDAAAIAEVVQLTDGFSFAYIQEMFVSATMQWMAARDDAGIRRIAIEQIRLLREQMSRA